MTGPVVNANEEDFAAPYVSHDKYDGNLDLGERDDDEMETWDKEGSERCDVWGVAVSSLLNSSIVDTYVNPQAPVYITNGLAGVKKDGEYKMDNFGGKVECAAVALDSNTQIDSQAMCT